MKVQYKVVITQQVQNNIRLGIKLFISIRSYDSFLVSFGHFFMLSLSPNIEIGGVWPPLGIEVLSPLSIPLFKYINIITFWLFFITWSHHAFSSRISS